jgi:hypothetical protein
VPVGWQADPLPDRPGDRPLRHAGRSHSAVRGVIFQRSWPAGSVGTAMAENGCGRCSFIMDRRIRAIATARAATDGPDTPGHDEGVSTYVTVGACEIAFSW